MKKQLDFSSPVNIKAFLSNEFGVCSCAEFDCVIYEVFNVLKWLSEEQTKRVSYKELLKSPGLFYIIVGVLEKSGLSNHGSSMRGAWITEEGQSLLEALEVISSDAIDSATGIAYDGVTY